MDLFLDERLYFLSFWNLTAWISITFIMFTFHLRYIYISLLIISCIIEYVTNKRTLNLDVEKSS